MNILQRLTLRTLKLNPKRTLVTVIGIILATSLITAVANVAESFVASFIVYEKETGGDYHYKFSQVSAENLKFFQNNQMVEKLGIKQDVGYAPLEGSLSARTPYLYLMAMDENGMRANALTLLEGRFPQAEGEIMIPSNVGTTGGVDLQVGDVLTLTIGERKAEGFLLDQSNPYREDEIFEAREEKEFLVVGKMERVRASIEPSWAPGYTAVLYLDPSKVQGEVNVYATYTKEGLKNRTSVSAGLLGLSEEEYLKLDGDFAEDKLLAAGALAKGFASHRDLIQMETRKLSEGFNRMLYLMAALAIFIIVVASVFCIRNSFTISLTEKVRLYGMLSSVGATRKQLRGLVYYEGFLLGILGIPLGVFCGVAATVILIHVTSGLMELFEGIRLIYQMSFPAMGAGALMAVVTIFFSAGRSARKAARVSPLSAIRGSEMIKIQGRERRLARKNKNQKTVMTRLVNRLFGIGGLIAYKNLRRSRGKYRTTVISIIVSVATFIAVSSLINIGFLLAGTRYQGHSWQLLVRLGTAGSEYRQEVYEEGVKIAGMEGIRAAEVHRSQGLHVAGASLPYNSRYQKDFPYRTQAEEELFSFITLGEGAYDSYVRSLGLDPERVWDQAILLCDYNQEVVENGERKIYQGELYDFHPGDVIEGVVLPGEEDRNISISVALQTKEHPMSVASVGSGMLVVSDRWLEQQGFPLNRGVSVYIRCEDPDALEKAIRESIGIPDYDIVNMAADYRQSQALFLLLGIFLYGFIIVIALIGVTNIFNTITTNMELRSREFAMLESVGMTGRQFGRMMLLENIFYGGKALVIGIPLGWILYAAFFRILEMKLSTPFTLPWGSSLLCVGAVVLILAGIMRYSMGKLRRRNIIETIQNENI